MSSPDIKLFQIESTLRELTANLLRMMRGHGHAHRLIKQIDAFREAIDDYTAW